MKFPVDPMKAVLGSLPSPADDDLWAYEIKFDGYRTVVHVRNGKVRVQSSSGADVTAKYPELADLGDDVNAASAIIDGELVVLDEEGRPRFELMQRHETEVAFYAFDVLHLDGKDTIALPYEQRRGLLAEALETGSNWMVPMHRVGSGAELLQATAERGLEGVMAKRLGSLYTPGKRSPNWRKVKNRVRTEVVIGGWSAGTGNRVGTFGALLVGVREPDGRLRFAGGVGSGFTQKMLESLSKRFAALRTKRCPFDPPPPSIITRSATWVEPELTAEIEITEFTNDGLVRQASFLGIVGDQPQSTSAVGTSRSTR